jgi:hypothetical protein
MNSAFPAILIVFALVVGIAALGWHFSRARSMLERWASDNGYQILNKEYRNLFRGPFLWTTSKGQAVYHVRVRDRQGLEHTGWVRCGSWFLGLISDKIEVKWDNQL